jgi:formate/nitrite transporter
MTGYSTPKEIAEQVAEISSTKAVLPMIPMVLLGMMAGAYIAFGAELATMVTHDLPAHVGLGLSKFVAGSVFSVGLMLVVLAGAELFTGNCLMLTGVLAGRCSLGGMLRNWIIVYLANFAGSLALVGIIFYSGLCKTGDCAVATSAVNLAAQKVSLTFTEAFMRGIACNWLVCLAVWLAVAGKDIVSKILGIYFPVMAFIASGFEHSIANMYIVPLGVALKGPSNPTLTWPSFLAHNLLPVTLGNIVGGAIFVGMAYYFIYLREATGGHTRWQN